MATHLSLRLAWHQHGWNGQACRDPHLNTYCVGRYSYPGEKIREARTIVVDPKSGNHVCQPVNGALPCAYSCNAFGKSEIVAHEEPPSFFKGGAKGIDLPVLQNTAFVWPYEEMYKDEVKADKTSKRQYNYDKRFAGAEDFFKEITPKQSLVFYYVNRSNPFSTDEELKFVLVGVGRVNKIAEQVFYEEATEFIKERYADGFIWQRAISGNYPDEGFRIPLQEYLDNPEVLDQILIIPEQTANFKYAARHINDDDALIYVERLLEVARYLKSIGDSSQDWATREVWLVGVIEELWKERGAYPGLPSFLKYHDFTELITYYKGQTEVGKSNAAGEDILNYLQNKSDDLPHYSGKAICLKEYRNTWRNHYAPQQKELIEKVLIRCALTKDQFSVLLSSRAEQFGITADAKQIIENPYLLSEQYLSGNQDDAISFSKIDHGVLPSPDLGLEALLPKNDAYRLRALVVDQLKREQKHTFSLAAEVIDQVNRKLSYLSEYKRTEFNQNYLVNNQADFTATVKFRYDDDDLYLYLQSVWQDERMVERVTTELFSRPDIQLLQPFSAAAWRALLFKSDSTLATEAGEEYAKAIEGQTAVCQALLTKPISVVAGGAGTGKTTIIKTLIQAIQKTSGNAASFCLLAPTGKAADRIREQTGKDAQTIHSFLARQGWLRDNFSYRQENGKQATDYTTYVIDEASMLDLSLFATFYRAVNWNHAKRLILVGDPNQLPPIGRGKVFADIITQLNDLGTNQVGILRDNLRQLANKTAGLGNGILNLASMFVQENLHGEHAEKAKAEAEIHFNNILLDQFDDDVEFSVWSDKDQLESQLEESLKQIEEEFKARGDKSYIGKLQIISPYRQEYYGTEAVNLFVQNYRNSYNLENKGQIGGITLFDKVIQFTNRAGQNAYWCYDAVSGQKGQRVEVFNGEIGYVYYNAYDYKNWKGKYYRVGPNGKGFQVRFERKPKKYVAFKNNSSVEQNLELAYAISVHKAQGSEFNYVFLILPQSKLTLLSPELLYTGITRAQTKLHVFIEKDYSPLLSLRRPEKSHLRRINASTFNFKPLPKEWLYLENQEWYREGLIHSTLTEYMVRSKSEVIIANLLHQSGIDFTYEKRLSAPDGTAFLPDFTLHYRGRDIYWEHLGMLDVEKYRNHWETKKQWYAKHFPSQLVTTEDGGNLTHQAQALITSLTQS